MTDSDGPWAGARRRRAASAWSPGCSVSGRLQHCPPSRAPGPVGSALYGRGWGPCRLAACRRPGLPDSRCSPGPGALEGPHSTQYQVGAAGPGAASGTVFRPQYSGGSDRYYVKRAGGRLRPGCGPGRAACCHAQVDLSEGLEVTSPSAGRAWHALDSQPGLSRPGEGQGRVRATVM